MSINAMANAAVARRPDYPPLDRPPQTAQERAEAASGGQTSETPVSTALKTLTTYLPTETLTLYVALIAALQPQGSAAGTANSTSNTGHWIAFWIFFVFTPLAVWITFATRLANDKKQLPLNPRYWPRWEMTAGTLAYVAWAVGLPDSPFAQFPWYSPAVAGFVVLVTSTLLGMLAGLFQRPIEATKAVQDAIPT
jgi:hypothetical protein